MWGCGGVEMEVALPLLLLPPLLLLLRTVGRRFAAWQCAGLIQPKP